MMSLVISLMMSLVILLMVSLMRSLIRTLVMSLMMLQVGRDSRRQMLKDIPCGMDSFNGNTLY